MSKSNPYASKKARTTTEESAPVEEIKEAVVIDVPSGSVNNVLKWVGTDADKARAAYAVETEESKPRVSLLSQLKELF